MATRRFGPFRRGFAAGVAAVCFGLSLHGARGNSATPGDGVYGPLVAAIAAAAGGLPDSALDVGCGHGLLVEAWREAGVARSFGLEGSPAAAAMWPEAFRDEFYKVQNLSLPGVAAAAEPTALVTSFEVGEHLPTFCLADYLSLLHRHNRHGLLLSWSPMAAGQCHINVRSPPSVECALRLLGYTLDLEQTRLARHRARLGWFKRDYAVYRRNREASAEGGAEGES